MFISFCLASQLLDCSDWSLHCTFMVLNADLHLRMVEMQNMFGSSRIGYYHYVTNLSFLSNSNQPRLSLLNSLNLSLVNSLNPKILLLVMDAISLIIPKPHALTEQNTS